MVLLEKRLSNSLKFFSKLEKHPHQPEALSASFRAFQSYVSSLINQLSINSNPGLEYLSLEWIQKCFEVLPNVHRAFAKLVVDIDYPMCKWGAAAIEEYLKYSLSLMELLNAINSALCQLGQTRISLYHALSLIENSPTSAREGLRKIEPRSYKKDIKIGGLEESNERPSSDEEGVIYQALLVLKGIGLWTCGVVLSSLNRDAKPYMELRKPTVGLAGPLLVALDTGVYKEVLEKGGVIKEVNEVNEAVARLVTAIENKKADTETKELQTRLEMLEKMLQDIKKEVDRLFSELLGGRNKILDGLRQHKNK